MPLDGRINRNQQGDAGFTRNVIAQQVDGLDVEIRRVHLLADSSSCPSVPEGWANAVWIDSLIGPSMPLAISSFPLPGEQPTSSRYNPNLP